MASYLITGASRGIGLELTTQLLSLPATQVSAVFALTRAEPPAPLQSLLRQHPNRAFHVLASVDDADSLQRAVNQVEARLGGGLDILVNNAAVQAAAPGGTRTVPPEQLALLFDVNVIGVHRVTSAFLPLLERGAQKKVINMYVASGAPTSARQ